MKEDFNRDHEHREHMQLAAAIRLLLEIDRKVTQLMATQDQEVAQLTALTTEIGNIGAGITALEAALAAAGGTTPAVDAALAALQAATDSANALLPAASAPPPAPTP